jgi:guanine nucleotide-binding protein subunit alpha
MGCGQSQELAELHKKNDAIETAIKKDQRQLKNEIKMLLLGTGESGKSTILKQMNLIHGKGYTTLERKGFKEIIYSNTLQSMTVILEAMKEMGISLGNETNDAHRKLIFDLDNQIEDEEMTNDLTVALLELWKDEGVQSCFMRSSEFQLNDSAE